MFATRAAASRAGDPVESYWRDIEHYELLSHEEEVDLSRRARAGDEGARQRLVTANLRFVVRVAREYAGRGLSLMELISEGNMGLLKAVDRYDETRGFKFITYAVWWIRQAILKALVQAGRARRSPMSRINDLRQIEREAQALGQELGRTPTFDELVSSSPLNRRRARNALEEARPDLSLDAPLRVDEKRYLEDMLADETSNTEAELDRVLLSEAVHDSLDVLDARERQVVRSYYGLEGYTPMTLEQIGSVFGVTRERARQLRDGALAKMRTSGSEELRAFSQN